MDLIAAMGAASTALGLAKSAVAADKAVDVADLKFKLAELETALANVRVAQLELTAENRNLADENKRLLAVGEEISSLVEIDGYCFQVDDNGAAKGWPACPSCLNKTKTVTILVQDRSILGAACPRCDAKFEPVTSFVAPGLTRVIDRQNKREALSRLHTAQIRNSRTWGY